MTTVQKARISLLLAELRRPLTDGERAIRQCEIIAILANDDEKRRLMAAAVGVEFP